MFEVCRKLMIKLKLRDTPILACHFYQLSATSNIIRNKQKNGFHYQNLTFMLNLMLNVNNNLYGW